MAATPAELLDQAQRALEAARYAEADALACQVESLTDDAALLARMLELRGLIAFHDVRYNEARTFGEAALARYVALGDRRGQGMALYLLGILHREINDIALALDYHQQQIAIALASDDTDNLMRAYNGMAGAYQFVEDYPQALHYLDKVLALTRQSGHPEREATVLSNQLQVYISMGGQPNGGAIIDQVLALYEVLGNRFHPNLRALFFSRASHYHLQLGEYDQAMRFVNEGLRLTDEFVLHRQRVILLGELGDIYLAMGQYGRAIPPLLEGVALAETHGMLNWVGGILKSLSVICAAMGDYQAAYLWQGRYLEQRVAVLDTDRQRLARQIEARYQVEAARREAAHFRAQADQSEAKRQALERLNRLKSDVLASASHDIKNPLSSIRLTLDLLRRWESIHPLTRQRYMTQIDEQIDRITHLIGNLLDLARLEAGDPVQLIAVDVAALFDWAIRQHFLRADHRMVRLLVTPIPSGVSILADLNRIEQVMDNLVSNAVKYTPSGGAVTLEAVVLPDEQIEIRIHDTGMGIPEADLPYIFDPFYRVRRQDSQTIEGTGLGLAIVQTIIQQHGSIIRVSSTVGQGSTFAFTLPAAPTD